MRAFKKVIHTCHPLPLFLSRTHSRRTSRLPSLLVGLSVSWALPAPCHPFPSVFLGFSPLPRSSSFQTFPLAPPSSVGAAEVPPWWGQPSPGLSSSFPSTRAGNSRADSRGDTWPVSPAGGLQLSRPAEEADPCRNWALSVGGREHSKCQAPEAGMRLVGCLVGGTDRIPVAECCQ